MLAMLYCMENWQLCVWYRQKHELVDGPNGRTLHVWDQRLVDLFEGSSYDLYDAALSDSLNVPWGYSDMKLSAISHSIPHVFFRQTTCPFAIAYSL
ncbi:hypothetical protein AQUCO_02600360v1 [Aquilegia coerulea]|uniref:Uncharacterized protein n=1 Tax=Aquilegia coerulea TaxID=218851 RepID=A0A2G5D8L1_AQUCA|nr:hypothetical protein AQUCO_02600360v1 [Aquilegia coerulea]